MSLDPELLEILACPEDKEDLIYIETDSILYNPRLRKAYEIRNGIPVLLVSESKPVNDEDHERYTIN
ncbi:MAG: protein YcaR in KDO2-Lipid A biosynthesis cluster [Acidimicrobiaceae bacterium]|nr:protein YcaR in KDO2-Lipid A biosynthesis cluster [Acidimicrobiaceae bacterium]OUV78194.1 MAG: protein YcaR in KDO2-Lipid A biosynthesis cluster [Acidimicrobiaceae bacterium TMED130]|tara:strand:- start:790 stop:990 length:201 start_codon:yes stop_codon:yes gene_type:complete